MAHPFDNTDWGMLRKQKRAVVRAQATASPKDYELLEGLLNFLDACQDYSEDAMGKPHFRFELLERIAGRV